VIAAQKPTRRLACVTGERMNAVILLLCHSYVVTLLLPAISIAHVTLCTIRQHSEMHLINAETSVAAVMQAGASRQCLCSYCGYVVEINRV
jgi:hypothetical protein